MPHQSARSLDTQMESTMELDDFKQAWQTLDRRLERQNAINLRLYTDGKLDKARCRPAPAGLGPGRADRLRRAADADGRLVLGRPPRHVPHLLVSGLLVHAYGLAITILAGITLGMIRRIDYAAPVLGIQKQLAELRRFYIRNGMVAGLSWWLLWMPFMAMFFMGGVRRRPLRQCAVGDLERRGHRCRRARGDGSGSIAGRAIPAGRAWPGRWRTA